MYLKRLKDLREDIDEKQSTIAKFLGITRQQYSLYETGKRDIREVASEWDGNETGKENG